MLVDAGLIEGIEVEYNIADDNQHDIHCYTMGTPRLSWEGHEFLDAARDPTTWEKAKQTLKETGRDLSTVTLSVLQSLLVEIAKKSMGL